MANKYILAINPGSTSTKIAIFLGEEKILGQNISHTAEELAPFQKIIDQHKFREKVILEFPEGKQVRCQPAGGRGRPGRAADAPWPRGPTWSTTK